MNLGNCCVLPTYHRQENTTDFLESRKLGHHKIISNNDDGSPLLNVQLLHVLFLDGSVLGIYVPEDEVELGVGAALVRPEHDRVGSLVRELPQVEVLVVAQQLDVAAAAVLGKKSLMKFQK